MEQSKCVTKYIAVDAIEYADLQAKCERYEAALEEIKSYNKGDSSAAWKLNQVQNIANEALSGEGKKEADEIFKKNVEAEITRRWNSMEYNYIGTRARESYREEVEKLFKKEDKQ